MQNKVIIAGSINMDIVVVADRHPKIGETVFGKGVNFFPGGKGANQAIASAKLDTSTLLIGRIGNDHFGDDAYRFLIEQGVDVTNVKRIDAETGTALITVASSDNTIVVVPGANARLTPQDFTNIEVAQGDVLVSQFEIPEIVIEKLFSLGKEKGATTILNPAPAKRCSKSLLDLVDILVLNETEFAFLTDQKVDVSDAGSIALQARRLKTFDSQVVIVTLGALGVIALIGEKVLRIPGKQVTAVDTTGAGDCFVGALASQLAKGEDIEKSLQYANLAASISVQRIGAGPSMPTRSELV
ncbi:MAG: ribokinase [bacterium]|nr:ribokinase [bacterium]